MRESDDAVVRRGRLFADSRRFGVETCGDYAQPLAAGVIGREAVLGDLFDLCAGRVAGRRSEDDITVFKNGGGGHLDLMIARALFDAASPQPIA
jgi:ornithine cyclodeaminase